MSMKRKIFIVLIITFMMFVLSSCDDPINKTFNSLLQNASGKDAYLWIGHGDVEPGFLVSKGQFKMCQLTLKGRSRDSERDEINDTVKVNASIDGKTVQRFDLNIKLIIHPEDSPNLYIRWNGKDFDYDTGQQ